MFDTVHLWLPMERAGNTGLLARVPEYLKDITKHDKESGEIYYSGQLKNYRINVSERGVSFKGSLAKYFLNDNYQTLNRGDSQRAFEMMADEIHLPIDRALVRQIDFAQNFIMDYAPESYYPYLGDCQHYKRLTQPQALYYSNGQRVKLFYNKIAEGRKSGLPIPGIWNGANVLRYEMRFKTRLPQQFNLPEITANLLYTERFYIELVNRWVSEYEAINKLHLINFNLSDMNSPKDFFKQLALLKIKEIGQSNAMQLVEDLRAKRAFPKSEYYSRLKRDIKSLCKEPELTATVDLVHELDKKVRAAKQYCR